MSGTCFIVFFALCHMLGMLYAVYCCILYICRCTGAGFEFYAHLRCCHTVRSYRTVYSVPYGISTLQNEKMISGDLSPFQKCTVHSAQTSLTFKSEFQIGVVSARIFDLN
jgi:hypothetical protein